MNPVVLGGVNCLKGCNNPVGGVAAEGRYLAGQPQATVHLLQPLKCFQHPRSPVLMGRAD